MTKVAILGGSGYTAVELIKILLRPSTGAHRSDHLASGWHAAHRRIASFAVGTHRLEMRAVRSGRVENNAASNAPLAACRTASVPSASSRLIERGIRVVDLSADYRLRDAKVHEQWYGEPPHDAANRKHAVYGLPELYAAHIKTARLVANPGCYPQTGILGLAPLAAKGMIDLTDIIVNSCSGISGAGRTPKLTTHFPECNESMSAYNVGKHRHTPEIEQALGDVSGQAVEVLFTPHLAPMDRGIFSTIYATPKSKVNEKDLNELYRAYYSNAPFVRVRDTLPATKDTLHTNFIDVCVKVVRGKNHRAGVRRQLDPRGERRGGPEFQLDVRLR